MKAIVTGGGGFLGKALARKLVELGAEVVTISRGSYPELKKFGITHKQVDISKDLDKLNEIFLGSDVVFHTAAKVDMWGNYEGFYNVNFVGTQNVITACRTAKVSSLVFTSSPSVIASGKDLRDVNETIPYPKHYSAFYPETKAMAEAEVLKANSNSLKTCSLRPHLIWGPGDTNLIPTIIERAKKKKLVQVGKGENKVDITYIEDCVQAHILAWKSLEANKGAAGEAFFISQGEPVKLWHWVNQVLEANNLPKISKKIPIGLAKFLSTLFEALSKVTRKEPMFTKFLVEEMSTDHYFDISKAKELIGFVPKYSVSEGMQKTFDIPSVN